MAGNQTYWKRVGHVEIENKNGKMALTTPIIIVLVQIEENI